MAAFARRLRLLLDPVFGVDLRSLALFRIGLASMLLWDLIDRSRSIEAHYTEQGALPVASLRGLSSGAGLSIHCWLSDFLVAQWALMALSFAAALALLLGFRTRAAAAVSWLLLVSLQVRSPVISWEGADRLLRILLLWSVLTPVGTRFSLDSRRAPHQEATWLCTPATALFVLQACALYWITGMGKSGETWREGTALAYALRIDFFGNPLGVWLRQFETPVMWLSHATLYLELLGPFLLLVPFHTWAFRLVAMVVFVGFHLGILVFMSVGFFSPISIVMWLSLIPSQVWDRAGGALGRPAEQTRLRTPRALEATAAVLVLFMVSSIGARAASFLTGQAVRLPPPVDQAGQVLRIRQYWSMFAPDPPNADLWPELRGRLAGGRWVDPFRGMGVVSTAPRYVSPYFPSFKWRIHFWILGTRSWQAHRPDDLWTPLAAYLCNRWNSTHRGTEWMELIEVVLHVEAVQLGDGPGPVHRWKLLTHPCARGRSKLRTDPGISVRGPERDRGRRAEHAMGVLPQRTPLHPGRSRGDRGGTGCREASGQQPRAGAARPRGASDVATRRAECAIPSILSEESG